MSQETVENTIQTLLTSWAEAKRSEGLWTEYRRNLEDQISALLGNFEGDLKELATSNTLTRSTKLPGIEIQFGYDMKLDQAKIQEFLASYPQLLGLVVKAEYKPLSSKAFLTAAAQDSEIGLALKETFERIPKRPYYAARPVKETVVEPEKAATKVSSKGGKK